MASTILQPSGMAPTGMVHCVLSKQCGCRLHKHRGVRVRVYISNLSRPWPMGAYLNRLLTGCLGRHCDRTRSSYQSIQISPGKACFLPVVAMMLRLGYLCLEWFRSSLWDQGHFSMSPGLREFVVRLAWEWPRFC
jgi:hypothetical protein